MSDKIIDLKSFVERFHLMKKKDKMDLSSDQDLSFAVMNLISIEEHLIFSGAKTEEKKYYAYVEQVRNLRKKLMKKLVRNFEGESWCISKHLLASTMRLMEVGTKQQSLGHLKAAEEYFDHAYDMYALFWGVNFNLISPQEIDSKQINEFSGNDAVLEISAQPKSLLKTFGTLVKKAINCCLE
jgi:hypothetical protein